MGQWGTADAFSDRRPREKCLSSCLLPIHFQSLTSLVRFGCICALQQFLETSLSTFPLRNIKIQVGLSEEIPTSHQNRPTSYPMVLYRIPSNSHDRGVLDKVNEIYCSSAIQFGQVEPVSSTAKCRSFLPHGDNTRTLLAVARAS